MSFKLLAQILIIARLLFPSIGIAEELSGRVVGVSDGDTITVFDSQNRHHKIRLAGIDAPESKQAFGTKSKQALSEMVYGKEVRAECPKVDRYGRKVCKVWVQPVNCPQCGETLDVSYAQISAGMAWWYRAYAKEQSPEDRGRYESEETEARVQKRGLWAQNEPSPPWEWRRQNTAGGGK